MRFVVLEDDKCAVSSGYELESRSKKIEWILFKCKALRKVTVQRAGLNRDLMVEFEQAVAEAQIRGRKNIELSFVGSDE